jgi:hypothetical protein
MAAICANHYKLLYIQPTVFTNAAFDTAIGATTATQHRMLQRASSERASRAGYPRNPRQTTPSITGMMDTVPTKTTMPSPHRLWGL